MKNKSKLSNLISLLVSVSLALFVGAVIMMVTGHSPVDGYGALLQGAFGSQRAMGNVLYKTGQLCITGLATIIASSAGIFNVGGEGQMYLGALASAVLGASLAGISPWIAIPVCALAAVCAGAFYAWIPAILKTKLKINEVITTILMNSIAILFCSWMANGPLKTAERGVNAGTDAIDKAFRFHRLIPISNLYNTIFYVTALTLIIWYLLSHTTLGFEMKATGQNSRFARFIGIKGDKLAILGMIISGGMCGLLGMFETFSLQVRFKPDFSNEFYFDGMLVAMIMRYQPLGTILMSFFFGILKTGASTMQRDAGISAELIMIVQSVIIFFMAAEEGILANLRAKRISGSSSQRVSKEVRG